VDSLKHDGVYYVPVKYEGSDVVGDPFPILAEEDVE
jgi:hypothetical protein